MIPDRTILTVIGMEPKALTLTMQAPEHYYNYLNVDNMSEEEKALFMCSEKPLTSPEEMGQLVKDAMKRLIYLRALKLRDAIFADYQQKTIILKESVELVKNYKASLLEYEEARKVGLPLPSSTEMYIIREHLNQILSFVTEYEIKLAAMKKLWTYFRTDYKDEVLKIITRVLTSFPVGRCDDLIGWETFIPQKMLEDAREDAFKSEYMPSDSQIMMIRPVSYGE